MNTIEGYRKIIVDEALSWIGTKYEYGCMQKGRGVDCARFGIKPYQVAGLIPEGIQVPIIERDRLLAGKSVDKNLFRNFILKFADEVNYEDRQVGDLVTFFVYGVESHIGVIVSIDRDYFVDAVIMSRVRKRSLRKLSCVASVYRHKEILRLQHCGSGKFKPKKGVITSTTKEDGLNREYGRLK